MTELSAAPDHKTVTWPLKSLTRSSVLAGIIALIVLALAVARLPLAIAAVVILAPIIAVLVLVRPALALAALALVIPFGGLAPLPVAGANIVDALVAVSVATWLLQGCAARKITLRVPPVSWPLLAFVWLAGLSLTGASSWREGVPELLKWVEFAAIYLVSAQVLTRDTRRWVIAALLTAGALQAAIGAYQFFRQAGPEPFIVLGRFLRAYGTFRQPNPYAGYLGYLFPVAASLALGAVWRWWQDRKRVMLYVATATAAVAAALAAGILMSWSRGAWLGLAAAAATVLGLRSRRTAAWTATAVAVLVLVSALFGIGWLPGPIEGRLNDLGSYVGGPDPARTEITDANFSVLERLAHWRAGLNMFADHPWLGVGIGNFAVNYPGYALPHWYDPLGHAHNVFINFLAETGILGASTFGLFWLGVAWVSWRTANRQHGIGAALAIGVLGAWVHLTVHSMFDNLFVQHMQLQLALLLGAIAVDDRGS